jgi:prophage regulatory protein
VTQIPKLAGLAEVAGLAGVSRARAGQITAHPDFPAPVQRLAMGPLWREVDVRRFLATPRKPGRKPKSAVKPPATQR